MTPIELRLWLEQRGAIYGTHFTFGGLGDDVPGFEVMGGFLYTYHAKKHGRFCKTDYVRHETYDAACLALGDAAIQRAIADGSWSSDAFSVT